MKPTLNKMQKYGRALRPSRENLLFTEALEILDIVSNKYEKEYPLHAQAEREEIVTSEWYVRALKLKERVKNASLISNDD